MTRSGPKKGASLAEIESLYRARHREFARVALAIVAERELALDVVQEAFARAVQRRAGFRGEGTLDAWLWRIVVRTAQNALRRPKVLPGAIAESPSAAGGESKDELREMIGRLPERQRLALFLRYYADLTYADIAETLGVDRGTVGSTLTAARTTLLALLEEAPR